MSFSTFLLTLGPWFPNEMQNLLSSEKRTLDHWATVQFFFSLAQVRRIDDNCSQIPWHVVCGGSWCLDPSLSPFLVKFSQILESILLDNPHKAAVLSVGCASFSSTLFPSTQLLLTCLDTASVNSQLLCQWMFVAYPPCEGCQDCLLDNSQISSLPRLCSLVNQTKRTFWRLRKPLEVFWVD